MFIGEGVDGTPYINRHLSLGHIAVPLETPAADLITHCLSLSAEFSQQPNVGQTEVSYI